MDTPKPDQDTQVRVYAQDVARICAQREPEITAATQAICKNPSRAAQLAAEQVTHWYAAAYPLKPGEVGPRPQVPVVCEPNSPSGLDPMSPTTEPKRAADPKLAAIGNAAMQSENARQAYLAQPDDQTRHAWTLALGSLQQLCLDFPTG